MLTRWSAVARSRGVTASSNLWRALSKPNPHPAAVFVDELNAGGLQYSFDNTDAFGIALA